MNDEEKSCNNCDHSRICKFKPSLYMGTSLDRIEFNISHKHFVEKVHELYGKYCVYYQFIDLIFDKLSKRE